MRLHLSGPISGKADSNERAFAGLSDTALAAGHTVFNPILECPPWMEWAPAIIANLQWLGDHADGMVQLADWTDSPGARIEHAFASRLGLPIWTETPFGIVPANAAATRWESARGKLLDVDGSPRVCKDGRP